jgi:hypothetical protein
VKQYKLIYFFSASLFFLPTLFKLHAQSSSVVVDTPASSTSNISTSTSPSKIIVKTKTKPSTKSKQNKLLPLPQSVDSSSKNSSNLTQKEQSSLLKKDLQTQKSIDPKTIIARSGPLQLNRAQVISALQRYRTWLHWSSSKAPSLDILKTYASMRRITIQAVERMLIAQEAQKRLGTPTREILRQWIMESVPGRIRPKDDALDTFIRGRLALKVHASLDLFWRSVQEMYLIDSIRANLLNHLDEKKAQVEWYQRGQLAHIWLVQIPRVPTHQEISQGIKKYQKEMLSYYQKNSSLFSQPERLLVRPYWLNAAYTDSYKQVVQSIAIRAQKGESIDELLNKYTQLRQGGTQTVPSNRLPANSVIKEKSFSNVKQTRKGWTFYQILRIYPGYKRNFNERSVQRELSASILRQKPDLPHARSLADQVRQLLKLGDEKQIIAWSKKHRIRFKKPNGFFRSSNHMIPQIGTAPQLHNEIFSLQVNQVSQVTQVRQNYVIARLVKMSKREKQWVNARQAFMKQMREELKPRILDQFLTDLLKEQPRWLSTSGLKSIDLKILETTKDTIRKLKEIKEVEDAEKPPQVPNPVPHH